MTKKQIGTSVENSRDFFVQTERQAHVEWGKLVLANPAAAAVMHQLVALMDRQNAVVIAHGTLSELVGLHATTIKKALKYLKEREWLQVVQVGPRGTVNAYVVNSQVAWADYRDRLPMAIFSARIVASASDQDAQTLNLKGLRKIPIIHPPEKPLPVGEIRTGDQHSLPGLEPVAIGSPLKDEDF